MTTRKRPYTPEPSTTNAPRQARLRERRKAEGWRRVSVWLSPKQVATLKIVGGDAWLGRTVKTLLERAVAEPEHGQPGALFDALSAVSDTTGDFSGTVKKGAGESAEPAKKGKAVFMLTEDKAALMAEVDSLLAQGLSGSEIARKFNDAGRRTIRGAAFTGRNVIRDWRKWKGEA